MHTILKVDRYLFLLILIDLIAIVYGIKEVSISYYEAKIFYLDSGFLHFILNIIGNNELNLRTLFALFHIFSIILFYNISRELLKQRWDSLFATAIFTLLPGVYSSAVIINSGGLLMFLTLLFVYIYMKYSKKSYYMLPFLALIDGSFNVLFLSLVFYSMSKKDNLLLAISLSLFTFSMYFYPIPEFMYMPSGKFIDYFALYFAIFSPLLFLYFFYSLYRIMIKQKQKHIIWYISFTTLAFTLLLSIRQNIPLDALSPFVVIAIVLMVQTFLHTYRVRLPIFRGTHKLLANIGLWILLINYIILVFNKSWFIFLENPKKHFAYDHYVAKELSNTLKFLGYDSIHTVDKKLALRLKFYGIDDSNDIILNTKRVDFKSKNITIVYFNNEIASFYVSKIYTKHSF